MTANRTEAGNASGHNAEPAFRPAYSLSGRSSWSSKPLSRVVLSSESKPGREYVLSGRSSWSSKPVSSISETTSDYVKRYMDDLNKRLAAERDTAEQKARSLAETKRKYPVQGRTKYLQSGSDEAQRLAKLRSLASQMTYYSGVAERANKGINDVAPQSLLEQLNALSVVDRSKVDDCYHKYYGKA